MATAFTAFKGALCRLGLVAVWLIVSPIVAVFLMVNGIVLIVRRGSLALDVMRRSRGRLYACDVRERLAEVIAESAGPLGESPWAETWRRKADKALSWLRAEGDVTRA